MAKLQDGETRLCLVDDLKVFKITILLTIQDKGTSSCLKSKDTTTYSQDKRHEVYDLKTKDKSIDAGLNIVNGCDLSSGGRLLWIQEKSLGQQHTEQPEIINEGRADQYPEQYQEKVFAIAALKNDLRKLKGNSIDTKFAKTSVLGKPVLQSLRNQLVVRQPNAVKSERPQMSKPWFASQVDVNNNLSRPLTQHYLPKRRESVFAKPDHMIASSKSRNSSKNMLRFSSNDMVHNHYLDEDKKKTQERDRNSKLV
ncbi:hypothetical protein Tco_0467970 [Tanacetum coccineum]